MEFNLKENILRSILGGLVILSPLTNSYTTRTMMSSFLVIFFGIFISGTAYNLIKERWNKKQKTGKN